MKRPTYAQILALVAEMVAALQRQQAKLTTGEDLCEDHLVGIVLRHVDSWAAKP